MNTDKTKERPILFSGPMVRAILNGTKTQTRRVMNVQPRAPGYQLFTVVNSSDKSKVGKKHWGLLNASGCGFKASDNRYFVCPYGKTGDQLWVRETWAICPHCGTVNWKQEENSRKLCGCRECMGEIGKWKPSIHMFRDYSRILLEITSVRVERVQDITEEDAKAEGIKHGMDAVYASALLEDKPLCPARREFMLLWDTLNAKRGFGWDENPWVWVLTFKTITPTSTL